MLPLKAEGVGGGGWGGRGRESWYKKKTPVLVSSLWSCRPEICSFIKKRDSDIGIFQWILQKFQEHLFNIKRPGNDFWNLTIWRRSQTSHDWFRAFSYYKLFNRSFFLFEVICPSLAIFHELLFENMTLKDNQFYHNSYLKYRNFHGINFSFCKIWYLRNFPYRVHLEKLITVKKVVGTHLRKCTRH